MEEVEKRYFVLKFRCINCDENFRLKELKIDFLGRFICPYCNKTHFRIRKKREIKSVVKGYSGASIVMVEHRRRKDNGL